MSGESKPVVLVVLDGWGLRDKREHNAVALANTPNFDRYWQNYPHSVLNASEEHVGLPTGQMGNSEIGHMTIGAGRILATDLVQIDQAIHDHTWHQNSAFHTLFEHVKNNNSVLHVEGLLSPGGVHSHHEHLHAFLEAAKQAGVTRVAIHAFTDGRDTAPQSAYEYLKQLEELIEHVGIGFVATVSGRFYAMDRDNNWDRIAKAEDALFECKGKICEMKKPSVAMRELYESGISDEYVEPMVFLDDHKQSYPIRENDGVFFFNYRADRARQLAQRTIERTKEKNVCFVTMTQYDKTLETIVAFPPQMPEATLADEISEAGLTQAHIAETEKYAHATYFLNGGQEEPHEGEVHVLVESRKDVPTHDLAPEMRAKEVADKIIEHINQGTDFVFVNFANADMVGHTGNEPAIITAIETVDRELGRVVDAALAKGGAVVITADHGNAETMIDESTGERHTAHTTNLVPFIIVSERVSSLRTKGSLADVAPTVLELFGLPEPASMTGNSMIASRK